MREVSRNSVMSFVQLAHGFERFFGVCVRMTENPNRHCKSVAQRGEEARTIGCRQGLQPVHFALKGNAHRTYSVLERSVIRTPMALRLPMRGFARRGVSVCGLTFELSGRRR
ncbi:hypothetical protein RA210_U290015 [Rubrivivax sp. A210]|nr:hypothetical protein RA210_U290015 [Rubrivivax sp. A210]